MVPKSNLTNSKNTLYKPRMICVSFILSYVKIRYNFLQSKDSTPHLSLLYICLLSLADTFFVFDVYKNTLNSVSQ